MNVVDMMRYGDGTLMGSIERFPADKFEIPDMCGWWSAKDILAHLTTSEKLCAEVLDNIVSGAHIATLDEWAQHGSDFNDVTVRQRQAMSLDEILAEYRGHFDRMMALARQISPETFRKNGTIPWYGEDYCLDDLLVYTNYAHKREHAGQLDIIGDRLR